MDKHHWILIGGALALLWYAKRKTASPAVAAASAPNAGATFTTQQSAKAADWWTYAGSWAA